MVCQSHAVAETEEGIQKLLSITNGKEEKQCKRTRGKTQGSCALRGLQKMS